MRAFSPRLAFAARVAAGLSLLVAGYGKLLGAPEEFALSLERYRLLPPSFLLPVARVLPWFEFLTGVYLTAGLGLRWTVPAALLLHAAFIISLGSALARGLSLEGCGCFGAWSPPAPAMLGWDILLFAGLFLVLRDRGRLLSLDHRSSPPLQR
jgi:uncharacterized membrane protein YphA (DoxX/SURF4 family)